jgi:hypothetical protein
MLFRHRTLSLASDVSERGVRTSSGQMEIMQCRFNLIDRWRFSSRSAETRICLEMAVDHRNVNSGPVLLLQSDTKLIY